MDKMFEVCRDGVALMSTPSVDAIYDKEILFSMKRAGYSFRLNGKAASLDTVLKFVDANKPKKK